MKLLMCIVAIFGVSVCVLQLRQEKLNLRYRLNKLHDQIESRQGELWNQQVKVAAATTPDALRRKILRHGGLPGAVEADAVPAGDAEPVKAKPEAKKDGKSGPTMPAATDGGRWLYSRSDRTEDAGEGR